MITITIYSKDGDEYPHGAESWTADRSTALPLDTGCYGMNYQYIACDDDGEIVGSWYSDSNDDVSQLPLAS